MKIFDREISAVLRKDNQKSIQKIGISLAVTVLVCVLCVCLVDTFGRFLCQTTATAATALFGCFCLMQVQAISHRRRVIALCEKTPGPGFTGLVQGVEAHTTTIEKLSFYGLDTEIGGTRKTFFLSCVVDPTDLIGKTVTVTAWDHIILELEVAP